MRFFIGFFLPLIGLILGGCSRSVPTSSGQLAHPQIVISQLQAQLNQWQGTPYRHGGLDRRGVDCSGFVWRTFRDRFDILLPRTTSAQTKLGTAISRPQLKPGDLVFFRTGSGKNGLHVGIYHTDDKFIHASTRRGVICSSLKNIYWKKVYWQARRI